MELRPILSAMRRNKVGAILIGVQMAITLAILCNALFIIEQRITLSKRPTGTDESNIFVINNQWVGSPTDLPAKLQADLAALRATPGVVDAVASNSYPLNNGGSTEGVLLAPEQKEPTALTALYMVDEHGLNAMGLKLIAGRNFNSDEVVDKIGYTDLRPPAAIIVTRALAEKLFPGGNAVGQSVYEEKDKLPIVGVVDRLQVPWVTAGGWGSKFNDNSIIVPFRFLSPFPTSYIVHAQPGQLAAVMQSAPKKLFDVSRERNVVVMLDEDTTWLHLGAEKFVERLSNYIELAPTLQEQFKEIDYVDLRFDERVYVKSRARTASAATTKR